MWRSFSCTSRNLNASSRSLKKFPLLLSLLCSNIEDGFISKFNLCVFCIKRIRALYSNKILNNFWLKINCSGLVSLQRPIQWYQFLTYEIRSVSHPIIGLHRRIFYTALLWGDSNPWPRNPPHLNVVLFVLWVSSPNLKTQKIFLQTRTEKEFVNNFVFSWHSIHIYGYSVRIH